MGDSPQDFELVTVGCGNMGSALTQGFFEAGAVSEILCVDHKQDAAESLAEKVRGRGLVEVPEHLSADPSIFLFAVKPADIPDAVSEFASRMDASDVVVSIAAGVETAVIDDRVPDGVPVIRAMPNVPAVVNRGVTGLYSDNPRALAVATALFESVGDVVTLSAEKDFDALTAVSGSGPAFVCTAIEAIADGAVKLGLDRETAKTLAVQTVEGTAAMVAEDPSTHTAQLKDEVASPGGTTIYGLAELERQGFRSALIEAICEAGNRSDELG